MSLTKAQSKRWRQWVKELRSGEYRQTEGFLCRGDGSMCCLGVACDVFLDDDWILSNQQGNKVYGIEKLEHKSLGVAPKKLQKLMGFKDELGFGVCTVGEHLHGVSIAGINDTSYDKGIRDYSEVIPHIINYYNANKHPDEPMMK